MPSFSTFSHPTHDSGLPTNYRLPPKFLRPILSALICSHQGHVFSGYGTASGAWDDEGHYRVCSRCALRQFDDVSSRERFDHLLAQEKLRHA